MLIHQSDLASFNRCPEQHRRQLEGQRGQALSATSYGSVMHHALHILERYRDVELAVNTFVHYWHPHHIEEIAAPVEIWIMGQSFSKLRDQGVETIRRYWDLLSYRDEQVLALEYSFLIDLPGTVDDQTGDPHQLAGTIDRLVARKYRGRWVLGIDDWKAGQKKIHLRHNLQGTGYALATTQLSFWTGAPQHYVEGFGFLAGTDLWEKFAKIPRRFTWIAVRSVTPEWVDGGERTPQHYAKFRHAVDQYVKSRQAGIFPLNIEGAVCEYCSFRESCPEERDH